MRTRLDHVIIYIYKVTYVRRTIELEKKNITKKKNLKKSVKQTLGIKIGDIEGAETS